MVQVGTKFAGEEVKAVGTDWNGSVRVVAVELMNEGGYKVCTIGRHNNVISSTKPVTIERAREIYKEWTAK